MAIKATRTFFTPPQGAFPFNPAPYTRWNRMAVQVTNIDAPFNVFFGDLVTPQNGYLNYDPAFVGTEAEKVCQAIYQKLNTITAIQADSFTAYNPAISTVCNNAPAAVTNWDANVFNDPLDGNQTKLMLVFSNDALALSFPGVPNLARFKVEIVMFYDSLAPVPFAGDIVSFMGIYAAPNLVALEIKPAQ